MKDLLLVVDMQNVYLKNQKWACLDTEGCARRILKLIDSGKITDVLFTRFIADKKASGVWADYNVKYADVNQSEYANAMVSDFDEVLKKYPLYTKGIYSSLAVPEVLDKCRKADRVFVTGVVAECCVLSTVLNLIDQGIYTVYVKDCVSGLDRPKEEATELILSGLSPLHVSFATSEEILKF
ncbi:isochorismatase family protein [Treponema sp.]|uniref:cysteine hydrolase family protein n=1 Tax=Treponema sp. TaxID=166 RepID=UPI0025CE21C0|nr:isochorismatase family protein [Treponema sp.]MCR5218933.1 isochorismatase family protein [Treponema sp.]